jgi:hypothetical protein
MSVPDRIYRIAKSYLDSARGRLADVDAAALAELDQAVGPESESGANYRAGSDDPMARAAAKIAAARNQASARREMVPDHYNFSAPDPRQAPVAGPDTDPIQTAYKVIGVPIGSNYAAVERAVNQLRERAAPSRFPDGSAEQQQAREIQERINKAFAVLQDALGVQSNRFDRLEL